MVNYRLRKDFQLTVRTFMIGLVLSCCVCIAQESRDTGAVAEKAATKKECRSTRSKGTKMRRSICLTREEWAEIDAQTKQALSEQEKDKDGFFRRAIQRGGLGTGDMMDNPNSPGT
jgi:hypothetical protein